LHFEKGYVLERIGEAGMSGADFFEYADGALSEAVATHTCIRGRLYEKTVEIVRGNYRPAGGPRREENTPSAECREE